MMKKITGILSALVLALALLPTTVFAAEDVAKITDITMTETGYPASGIKIMAAN